MREGTKIRARQIRLPRKDWTSSGARAVNVPSLVVDFSFSLDSVRAAEDVVEVVAYKCPLSREVVTLIGHSTDLETLLAYNYTRQEVAFMKPGFGDSLSMKSGCTTHSQSVDQRGLQGNSGW